MTDPGESALEERLRDHYRSVREQQPADQTPPPEGRRLVGAVCLVLLVALGGAYLGLRQQDRGQPIQAEVGADGESTGSLPAEPSTTQPTESAPPILETDTTTSADGDPTAADGSTSSTVAAEARSSNVDGSPIAPTPGSVAPPEDAAQSAAFGVWTPTEPHDTCSKELHDSYWVYGPDGKVYPTYHPPVDPVSGCTFGHEHGRDPALSDLADIPFPFGYVEEQAVDVGISDDADRVSAHVSHKIEWYNDGGYYQSGSSNDNHDQICDVAYKVSMDTHSDAAFANNAHEVFHYARCENGSELIYRALHRFGNFGEFQKHCDQRAGPTVTIEASTDDAERLSGRELPAAACFEDRVLVPEGQRSDWNAFDERWTLYHSIDSADFGRFFIQFFFFADLPARYWDGEKLAHTVDLCYQSGPLQVRDDEYCEPMRAAAGEGQVGWDDPASPFNGTGRTVFMGDLRLDNNAGQDVWYTDINGGVWSAEPFPGSIQQYVGIVPFDAAASYRPSPTHSITFEDGLGIHPPN